MASNNYQVFIGYTYRKQRYLVSKPFTRIADFQRFMDYARRFFKCNDNQLVFKSAWIYKGELYLTYPFEKEHKGVKRVNVFYYSKRGC